MITTLKQIKQLSLILLLSIAFITSYYTVQFIHDQSHNPKDEVNKLSYGIDYQRININDGLNEIRSLHPSSINNKILTNILNNYHLIGFALLNDSLVFWNNNIIDPWTIKELYSDSLSIYKLPSGWYLISSLKIDNWSFYILDLIQSDYQVNNPSLKAEFNTNFYNIDNLELNNNPELAEYSLFDKQGKFVIGADIVSVDPHGEHYNLFSFILYIAFIISISVLIFKWLKANKFFQNKLVFFTTYSILIITLWLFQIVLKFPIGLKQSILFADLDSVNSFIGSIGEAYILAIFLSILAIAGNRLFKETKVSITPIGFILNSSLLWLYTLIITYIVYSFAQSVNFDSYSDIDFTNQNLFQFFALVLLMAISAYFFISAYLSTSFDLRPPIFIPIIISLIGILVIFLITNIHITILILVAIIAITLVITKYYLWNKITDRFLRNLIILVYLSLIISVTLNIAIVNNNDLNQIKVAKTLSLSNDTIFEKHFHNISSQLKTDSTLYDLVFTDSVGSNIKDYLQKKYFSGDYLRYNIQITSCNTEELIEIQPEGEIYNCIDYFNSLINDFTVKVQDSTLFQFNSKTEGYYYLSKLHFKDELNDTSSKLLFIEFVSSFIPDGLGYPELLYDRTSQLVNLANYSFARYDDAILDYKFGDFAYNTFFSSQLNFHFNDFFEYGDYKHYAIATKPESYLIVSRKIIPVTIRIVIFSILFITLSIIAFIAYIIIYAKQAIELIKNNFKTRLQTFVLATLTITFIIITVSSLYYIKQNITLQLEKKLSEKSSSVLIELQHKLSNVSSLSDEDPAFLEQLLRKFSLVFFSDINLFDKSGKLIASSRPEIFEKNLLSKHINPLAYDAIFDKKELNYILEEKIGSIKYFSSYVPINLGNNEPVGIVNLPYFARQSEYTESYFIMLSYLLNIYVIVGIIGALIAVTFSRYLTRPLVLLQKNISDLRIDKQNAKISWNKNDEIGQLINEYNNMVEKLKQSTDLLLRSERESAWREIAKQIAHEIKNPLTPMKLNVQYLEKAYKDNDPDFNNKIVTVGKSLIDQIDTLNNVAEKFSDFAKTNSLDFEVVNLKNIVVSSAEFYNKKSEVEISLFEQKEHDEYLVRGFEKDLIRVFNNIITNSLQALDGCNEPKIEIELVKNKKTIIISIKDNGKGIPNDMFAMIFQPYFTTKTSGTGLGLAIVKNIITDMGGEISFVSQKNEGTTFYLKIPEYIQ